jgi:hypothetical protein
MMYPQAYIPDTLGAQLDALCDYVGPSGGDWLFQLCRQYRAEGMPFAEAMAKAKRVLERSLENS